MSGVGESEDAADEAPAGVSVWERDLWELLTKHVKEEKHLLATYTTLADETKSEAFAYLVNLLVEDEVRHHRIFAELAASLKIQAELGDQSPIIPAMDFANTDRAGVLEATELLLKREEQDLRDLRRLEGELHDVRDTTLWSLLIDLMQRDTQKHIAILRFARDHAG